MNSKTTVSEIIEMGREQGFEITRDEAKQIKIAGLSGSLIWTSKKIVTTDGSRISMKAK